MISDPVLHWPLDEAGGTVAADTSGNGRDGTVTGTTRIGGKVGAWALRLDGTGADHVDLASEVDFANTYTVACWVCVQEAGDGILFGGGAGSYAFYYDATDLYHSAGSGNFVTVAHGGLGTGWHHIAITRAPGGAAGQFYKNGGTVGSPVAFSSPSNALRLQRLGGYANGSFPAQVDLDDVRVYGRALDPGEIADLYALGAGGITITLGIATSTEIAMPLTVRKVRAIGAATEVDTAPVAGRVKARAIGTAAETGFAQPVATRKTRTLSPATETGVALGLGTRKTRLLGVAAETDHAIRLQAPGAAPPFTYDHDPTFTYGPSSGEFSYRN